MASRDPLIEPYRPRDSSPTHEYDYDYDYDYEPGAEPEGAGSRRGQVLWGRVAILGAALLFAFLIGRVSAPSGIPETELRAARTEARAAEQEADRLREELATAAMQSEGVDEEKAPKDGAGKADDEAAPEPENKVYAVQSGDTLSKIAEKFYGDASLDDFLAEANPDINPLALRVGQEIVIPPKPEE